MSQLEIRYKIAVNTLKLGGFDNQEAYYKEIVSLAHEGYHPAQARLAYAYYRGIDVEENIPYAFKLAQASAARNNRSSKYLLGLLFRDHALEIDKTLTQQ